MGDCTDLLTLQGRINEDAPGYREEFLLQLRHYKACLELFTMSPNSDTQQFASLVRFIATVSSRFPDETSEFGQEIMNLLDHHGDMLDSDLRKALVQGLVLLRRRSQIAITAVLPLFFRLFHCPDKSLRRLLYKHLVSDIKKSHQAGKGQINKRTKGFLLNMINNPDEIIAKKSLTILSDLWRREVWRDIHTANVIGSALEHSHGTIVLAATKFFLGFDVKDDDLDSDDDEEELAAQKAQLDTNDVRNANLFGSKRSMKKKRRKLERVQHSLRKNARKELSNINEGFTAIQLLQDPQRTSEKLFQRVKSGKDRFESKLAMIQLISRIIGIHKLMMLNFYPFLQKYLITRQQDVMQVMSSLVQACHELVPPDALSLVLRHLVDTFVHDRARPEVITIGIKTVREICVRVPMVMSEDLLSDLAMYKSYRDKEVSLAARGLISLFREVAPGMLQRKFRGRGANLEARPPGYGAVDVKDRIAGAELLEAAIQNEDPILCDNEFDEDSAGASSDMDHFSEGSDDGSEIDPKLDTDLLAPQASSSSESLPEDTVNGDEEQEATSSLDEGQEAVGIEEDNGTSEDEDDLHAGGKRKREADPDSMRSLKKRIAAIDKSAPVADGGEPAADAMKENGANESQTVAPSDSPLPLEMTRVLDDVDFANMRKLQHKQLVHESMKRHGIITTHKKHKLEEIAEADAHEAMRMTSGRSQIGEEKVEPGSLMGKRRGKPSKLERVTAIVKGREGNEFKSASSIKKKKAGGTSNKEKMKRMDLPLAARIKQAKNRIKRNKERRNPKNFKGHFGKSKGGVRKK